PDLLTAFAGNTHYKSRSLQRSTGSGAMSAALSLRSIDAAPLAAAPTSANSKPKAETGGRIKKAFDAGLQFRVIADKSGSIPSRARRANCQIHPLTIEVCDLSARLRWRFFKPENAEVLKGNRGENRSQIRGEK